MLDDCFSNDLSSPMEEETVEVMYVTQKDASTSTDDINYSDPTRNCSTQTTVDCKNQSVQVETWWVSIQDFVNTDRNLNILTGITSITMLDWLTDLLQRHKNYNQHRLTARQRIIMTFLKMKLDLPYAALGVLFRNVSKDAIKRSFVETVNVLSEILKHFIRIPSSEEIYRNMPVAFSNFQNVRLVLDCVEIRLQSSKKLCCRVFSYSNYKKYNTIKFMTAVTPDGRIAYVSRGYGGRASDKAIFGQSKLINKLTPFKDAIMVDKGFLIDQICAEKGIELIRPSFLKKKKQFSSLEATKNREIASARVHVERANARLKIFKIFRNCYPHHLIEIIDNMFKLICAMFNLSAPILKDRAFLK